MMGHVVYLGGTNENPVPRWYYYARAEFVRFCLFECRHFLVFEEDYPDASMSVLP